MSAYEQGEFPRYSRRIYWLLRKGDVADRYGGDPFRVACAIIAEANRVGMPVNAVLSHMLDESNHGGEWVRSLAASHQHRFVSRMYEKAGKRFDQPFQSATDARLAIHDVRERVFDSQWPPNQESRIRVLLAHLDVMLRAGTTRYSAGMRQLAVTAGVGFGTVQAANRWLIGEGVLSIALKAKGDKATTYRLQSNARDKVGSLLTPIKEGTSDTRRSSRGYLFHPAFSHGSGLSWRTWSLLPQSGGVEFGAVVEACGYASETVERHLRNLRTRGLAEQLDDGTWIAVEDETKIDQIALESGLAGRLRDRADRFELQQIERRIQRMLGGGEKIDLATLYRGKDGAA
jgi:hypothetical protein